MNNKQKLLAGVFVALLLTAGVVWFAGTDKFSCLTVTYEGNGTEENPYEVGDAHQLQCIEEQDLGANYVQVSEINASGTSSWDFSRGFDPIGGTFRGTFDGQGYNIMNLTIDRGGEENSNVGLFDFIGDGSTVTNISVVNADITGFGEVGGLVGYNDGTISEACVTGSVSGFREVGGLVGNNGQGKIEKSYATGALEASGYQVGGLVGWNAGTVSGSYATGSVNGTQAVGGLVGWNIGTIREGYATGPVSGSDSVVGGLVGFNDGNVYESYATGAVYSSESAGGLIGLMEEGGTVNESYWDTEATGQSTSAGNGTGLTTSEMVGSDARDNMRGFDSNDTWETVTNPDDYPVLAWQTENDTRD